MQEHPNALMMLDEAAAADLTRFRSPWLLGPVLWDDRSIRKAVIWLARRLKKPILKLTAEDYNESLLQDLLADHGPAYTINIDIFRSLQETISGWPGRQAAEPQAPRRHRSPGRRHLSQARADLLAASGRRRHLDGRHSHPPGGPGA